MLKLMKYEFRKTAFSKLILLCITMVMDMGERNYVKINEV